MTPSEYFKKPVLGKIKARVIGGKEDEYEFIDQGVTVYICNQWYKEYKEIPQLVPKQFVIEEILYGEGDAI
jgi:hypothetical protein